MFMPLTMGFVLLAATAVLIAVALVICRNPRAPQWLAEGVIPLFYLPLVVGLFAVGVAQLVYAVLNFHVDMMEVWDIGLAAISAVVGWLAVKFIGVKNRLIEYRQLTAVVDLPPRTPQTPTTPSFNKRAA